LPALHRRRERESRILEFTVGYALEQGADVLIGGAGSQSNHCRQLAAAAAKLGVDCHLLVTRDHKSALIQGNRLLDDLLGATVEIAAAESIEQLDDAKEELRSRLQAEGRKPFVVMQSSMRPYGAMGYALCMAELMEQLQQQGLEPSRLVVCSSSATQPGLIFGNKVLGAGLRITGISPISWSYDVTEAFLVILRRMAELLEIDVAFDRNDVENLDTYIGEKGYGYPSPEGNAALRLLASTEGIFVDPIYSAKALAALIDMIRRKHVGAGDTVVFLHTGGTPALFAYADELGV
jgi:1-aminocyclopropane-1-carboxylate deaminase/D-cysteine desulfhydrase-like pyridoxal-dependent ACC family enzyme